MSDNTITLSIKLDANPAAQVLKAFIASVKSIASQTKQALNIDIKPIDFSSSISAVSNLEESTTEYNTAAGKSQKETEQLGDAATAAITHA